MPAWLARPEDSGDVTRLMIAFRDHLGYAGPPDETFATGVERLIAAPDTEFLLAAADDGTPAAGVAQLRFRWGLWRGGDCLLEDVFVSECARGAGLGRALVELAGERALARGCGRIELDTSEDNVAALALYRSFGFSERAFAGAPRDLYMRRHL